MKKLYGLICVLLNLIFNFLYLLTLVIIFNWLCCYWINFTVKAMIKLCRSIQDLSNLDYWQETIFRSNLSSCKLSSCRWFVTFVCYDFPCKRSWETNVGYQSPVAIKVLWHQHWALNYLLFKGYWIPFHFYRPRL